MLDLHAHDEFSLFDGFGKATERAIAAKENGLIALGLANHGNVNGLVEHYYGCKKAEIKPILGSEVYFQIEFDEKAPTYHLCLFAKNLEGYRNLNKIITIANRKNFYYKAIVTLNNLRKHSKGLICTSACIAGLLSACIKEGSIKEAVKVAQTFKDIFEDDFYIEIMPYKVSEKGLQERINEKLMAVAQKLDIKCILTSDSHFPKKEDFDTYIKMHEVQGHGDWAIQYKQRYIPKKMDLFDRFVRMHEDELAARKMYKNMKELNNKVEEDILGQLENSKIVFDKNINADELLIKEIKLGLKRRGQYNKEYLERCKQEYKIIKMHGFSDYFLIVQDYVRWAKEQGIAVGPGRGSVCNSEVAYALGITEVDSIYFELDFTRFLREDKTKMPDIDLDFETARRQEVIEYVISKYPGCAAQICSFGLYKVDNTLNDLFKVCGVEEKQDKLTMKDLAKKYVDSETDLDKEGIMKDPLYKKFNEKYDGIMKHFVKMYKKVRYIGTHAAGVAIVGTNILDYAAVEKRCGKFSCVYDLSNLDHIKVLKFDMLGLRTLSEIKELEQMTKEEFTYDWFKKKKVYELFREGDTDGIFQFERRTVKNMLVEMDADCMNDLIAANAMNRPGPLQLGMPQQYAANKQDLGEAQESKWYKFTKDSYGTIIYQEQITAICREYGEYTGEQVDTLLKTMKSHNSNSAADARRETQDGLRATFVQNARKHGLNKQEANDLFDKMLVYSFNKGHSTAYAIIPFQQMFYKIFYPEEFWLVKLKYSENEVDFNRYKQKAAKAGNIILIPHVNGTAKFSIVKVEGTNCLQEGLVNIKDVGQKTAEAIETERKKNGDYKNITDLINRIPKRQLNCKTINALEQAGATEFREKKYWAKVEQYNSSLFGRGSRE